MDDSLVLTLHNLATSHATLATLDTVIAESGIFLLPLALLLVWFRTASAGLGPREAVLTGFVAAALAFGVGYMLEQLLSRPRPFVALGLTPLFAHAADSSFPSDHTLLSVALVGPLLWRLPRVGIWLFGWAMLIGMARVAAGVHYPSDVVGSAILALAIDALVWLALRPVLARVRLTRWDVDPPGSLPGARRR
ncbi:MAG TPA: phosphatase PAP2 family protein [Chloroflexota bacterium]